MAIVYLDFLLGNDTSGDGTWSAPYKTMNKATTGLTGGDEVRVAQSPQVQLSGTLTFTNGSNLYATSVDVRSEVAIGDFIKHGADNEAWWYINYLTSATEIRGPDDYWGTDGAGKTVTRIRPYEITLVHQKILAVGTSRESRLKISGGWDLSTQTKVGLTATRGNYSILADYVASAPTRDGFVEISDFVCQRLDTEDVHEYYIHDCCSVYGWMSVGARAIMENCWLGGSEIFTYGSYWAYDTDKTRRGDGNGVFKNIWIYTQQGVENYGSFNYFENINISGHNQWALYYVDNGCNNFFKDCTFDMIYDADYGLIYYDWGSWGDTFYNCTFKNSPGAVVMCESGSETELATFIDCTFENNTLGICSVGSNTDDSSRQKTAPLFIVQNSTGDSFRWYKDGATVTSTATGSRSGACLKFSPVYVFQDLQEPVGAYKIVSDSSAIDLCIYLKKDESFVGDVWLMVIRGGGCHLGFTSITSLTTEYVKQTVTIATGDLVIGEYLTMYVVIQGSAGNLFADDFSAE